MSKILAIVITSILNEKNAIKMYANKISNSEISLYVIGDKKCPVNFSLKNCKYYSLEQQKKLPYKFVSKCPVNNYARKNIGYLEAIKSGHDVIVETDDDNFPLRNFWDERNIIQRVKYIEDGGWVNVYEYFSDEKIWPRGFPLEHLDKEMPLISKKKSEKYCPIQQGLVDIDPDVDAVYRMIHAQDIKFAKNKKIALGHNAWCPFNSQNTTWFKKAFPLMYLPSYCSIRLTDIWRSFIAQRVAWACGWNILFHSPNVYQNRNKHNLLNDFEDEIPGYLYNNKICNSLNELDLKEGVENLYENLFRCYRLMIKNKWIGQKELKLLEFWINDFDSIT